MIITKKQPKKEVVNNATSKTFKLNEGIFYDLPNKEYHSIDGISSTQFQDMELSIAIFQNREHFKYDCRAFADGSLNHTMLLEPDKLDEYMETTTQTYETKVTEKLKNENPDKIIVSLGSIEVAEERAMKVKLVYGKFIANAVVEVSIFVYDEDIKMWRKCRADIWLQKLGIVLDYKTSKETTIKGFMNTIEQYNYHLSAAWYTDTINMLIEKLKLPFPKVTQFGWVVSPNYKPYKPYGLICSQELQEKGREKYNELLNKYISVRDGGQDELFKVTHSWEYRKENY